MGDTRMKWAGVATIAAGLAISSVALGLPWDLDLIDTAPVKAYEQPMTPLPEGVVSQRNILSPNSFAMNISDRNSAEARALPAPFPSTAAAVETGDEMYRVYCTPCHGDGSKPGMGPVAKHGAFASAAVLSGNGSALPRLSDGQLYLTIRNGGLAAMPGYGWAMTDGEIWSLVHYMRTLDNSAYVPPAPVEPDVEETVE